MKKLLVIFIVLVAFQLTCSGEVERSIFLKGLKAFGKRDYKTAIMKFEEVLAISKDHAQAKRFLKLSKLKLGKKEPAGSIEKAKMKPAKLNKSVQLKQGEIPGFPGLYKINTHEYLYKKDNSIMVKVPSSKSLLGSGPTHSKKDERPQVTVLLDTFFIDKYEVSAEQFAKFLNKNGNPDNLYFKPSEYTTIIKKGDMFYPGPGFENYPANGVTWFGAKAYAKWVGKSLPTEAEWEKAARGPNGRFYPFGNRYLDSKKANYGKKEKGVGYLAPVDSHKAGASYYGCLNMAGNVAEWVLDKYNPDYFKSLVSTQSYRVNKYVKNPKGPHTGIGAIIKGGSFRDSKIRLRSAARSHLDKNYGLMTTGFRCVYRKQR